MLFRPTVDDPVGDLLAAAAAVHHTGAVVSARVEEPGAAWILTCYEKFLG